MVITPLPTPPSRSDPDNFAPRGDEFMAALPVFAEEANLLAGDMATKQETASAAAVTATEQAGIATTKAGQAADRAGEAMASRNAAVAGAESASESRGAAEDAAAAAHASKVQAAAFAASIDPQALSSEYPGPDEPPVIWPYMKWANTGVMRRMQRNSANTAWVDIGPLLVEMAAKSDVIPAADLQWLGMPLGVPFPIWDHIPGVPIPPTDDPRYRYIKLTAGDPYNAGVLTGEAVSGSSPTIIATAIVSIVGCPFNGQAVDLINTSRPFLRPGVSGVIVGSQNKSHTHAGTTTGAADVQNSGTPNRYSASGGVTTGAQGGDEGHPRFIGATYFMRAK